MNNDTPLLIGIARANTEADGAMAQQAAMDSPQWRPVYDAIKRGLNYLCVPQHTTARSVPLSLVAGPLLLYLGDDLDDAFGPGAFPQKVLRRALELAVRAAVISCELSPQVYRDCAEHALQSRGVSILIETRQHRALEWYAFIRKYRDDTLPVTLGMTMPWTIPPHERRR